MDFCNTGLLNEPKRSTSPDGYDVTLGYSNRVLEDKFALAYVCLLFASHIYL